MKRNIFRLLLSAVLMMCCTVMANAQIDIDIFTGEEPQGSGTQSDPYKIDNYGKLYRFSLMVNAGSYSPAYAELTADITADGVHPWIPIGNDTRMYVNEFNGNGYVISGLTNNGNSADACCLGLFGKIGNNGSVHDVGVENCNFYGQNRVGAICGDLAEGEVYNCWSSGQLWANSAAGGLVGSCWYNSKLRNCYTSCGVVASLYADQYIGGVCGSVAGKVENCFMMEKTGGWAENPIGATYGETSVINNVAAKPNGAFSSGEVCWLLNGGVTDGSQGWYQTLGTDNMPSLSKSSKTVSRCSAKCAPGNYIYNNDNVETDANHALAYRPKYSCASTGYDTEYWECLGCHKLYSDKECTREINQSDLGEIETTIIITKDAEWQYTDEYEIKEWDVAYVLNILYSSYYIDIPAPGDGSTKTTSISFTVNVDNFDFTPICYDIQYGINRGGFIPDVNITMKCMVNDTELRKYDWGPILGSGQFDYFKHFGQTGDKLDLGHLMKGDVVKIEISLTKNSDNANNRNYLIVFSVPQAVHPTHKFKHVDATSLYREHWECEHCHNVFTSDAHPDSDKDICSLDDLAYEEPMLNNGYYEIRNEGTLYWLAREVNEKGNTTIKARLTADIRVNNNVLDQNGNLNDASSFRRWTPIGNDDHPFIGEFDGNGHTISGLYQKDDNWDAGLFGYMTTGGKVKNVIVKDSYLFGQYPTWKEGQQGQICYRNWNGGSVTDSYISMGKVLGGYVSVASNSERHVTDAEFNSGEATWMLNGEKIDTKWRQQIGKDAYPVLTGNYLVNHSEEKGFYNETMCEKENGIHSLEKKVVTKCDNSTIVYWHCSACGKDFTDADRAKEETNANKSSHFPEYVMGIVPTETTEGCYGHYKCTKCSEKFKDEPCHQPWENDNDLIVPKSNNNEIWYTSTNNQRINPYSTSVFGATITDNKYEYGIGVITFDKDVTSIGKQAFDANPDGSYYDECVNLQSINIPSSVTSIGNSAFWRCTSLHSINIPSGVTSIGKDAFYKCGNMESITFNSLPNVDYDAFYDCNISTKVLDLTDSDKPYIGTSLNNYPSGGFTEARYHRTLEKDKWATIVLPFVPSTASVDGLEFYIPEYETDGMLAVSKTTDIKAGVPYLVQNTSKNKTDFTMTAENPSAIIVNISEQPMDGCTMMGTFQSIELNSSAIDENFYYFDGDYFMYVSGKQTIDPFRAYIQSESSMEKYVIEKDPDIYNVNMLHIDFADSESHTAPVEKEHYMDATEFTFNENGDMVFNINRKTVTYPKEMIDRIKFSNGIPTVEFKANEDPKNEGDYYTTFYSSLEAYTIPEGVKAYTATLDKKNEILNLKETSVIPAGAAVILKSGEESFSLTADEYVDVDGLGDLKGTDVEILAPENCYILSGTSKLGMGLYPWAGEGKKLSANKAYLQQTEASSAKAFMFNFVDNTDNTDGIENTSISSSEAKHLYNLQGIRVNDRYKGIVIKNGKKTLNK